MHELELLDAEILGASEDEAEPGPAWWKWLLGLGAAAGLGYFLLHDVPLQDVLPRPFLHGSRPW